MLSFALSLSRPLHTSMAGVSRVSPVFCVRHLVSTQREQQSQQLPHFCL